MKCQHCNKNDANTHYKKTINGVTQEVYLCSKCAKEIGIMDEFSFDSSTLFSDLFSSSLIGVDRCSYCGSTMNEIAKNGKVGCANCYTKFGDRLVGTIEKMNTKAKHIGKSISYTEVDDKVDEKAELEKLKQMLKQAVKEQRFEDAAVLRDKIKELSQES